MKKAHAAARRDKVSAPKRAAKSKVAASKFLFPFQDPSLPIEQRVSDLLSRLTPEEKISQMVHAAPGIARLGIPPYNWWNECLHGVGRAGRATVFPQAIGLAATWDVPLLGRIAEAISDEARAKHHEALRMGRHGWYQGLTYWSPNVNIFRDPRWGRGHETYGECPVLTGRLGVAFTRGLQGTDKKYLKLVATPKHYAVHSGPEPIRHGFDAVVNQHDLFDTYLSAFEQCVREAKAASIMGAYNRTNGEACCASPTLLQEILRKRWGFDGFVVSDCGAIDDIWRHHGLAQTAPQAAALAVKNGCELNCGNTYNSLRAALDLGLIAQGEIDLALGRLLRARFQLGMFDPPSRVPFAKIPPKVIDCPAHQQLARQAARESIVLLKNDGILPLRKDATNIAIFGQNAQELDPLLGNYTGLNAHLTTIVEGIVGKVSPATIVAFEQGCEIGSNSKAGFDRAMGQARQSDIMVVVLGLSPRIEGEEGAATASDAGGDRKHIDLPGQQQAFLEELKKQGKPIILVLLGGSAMAVPWADQNASAILCAWYPGQAGGDAVADVLFGDTNPSGRLPVTFYKGVEQLPPFEDYAMEGRTYRYFRGEPLWPFGFGLSYTTFAYENLKVASAAIGSGESMEFSVDLRNTGKVAGDEVVQVYVTDLEASVPVPIRTLADFRRVSLRPGQKKTLKFRLPSRAFSIVDNDGRRIMEPGRFRVSVGGGQPNTRSQTAGSGNILTTEVTVTGQTAVLE